MTGMSRPAKVSLVSAVLLLMAVEAIIVAWAVQYSALESGSRIPPRWRKAIGTAASFPTLVKASFRRVEEDVGEDPIALLINVRDSATWRRRELRPDTSERGYLLLSGVDSSAKQSTVRLVRLSNDQTLWVWRPDFRQINTPSSSRYVEPDNRQRGRILNPLPQRDGSLIFNSSGSRMARMDRCGRLMWALPGPFHHSGEQDRDGNIWVPSVRENSFPQNKWMNTNVRDDAIAKVDTDGKVLQVLSMSDILIANGLRGLLLGQVYQTERADPIHLNDVEPALTDGEFWKAGDLLLSARHLSTVFLFRPSTGRILWHKTGPWLAQHDVNFLGARQISVFGNDVLPGAPTDMAFITPDATNQVYVYDFKTDSVTTPYSAILGANNVRTITQGRASVDADGVVFVEETQAGRHLRATAQRLLWSRVNWYDSSRVGLVSWSRYLAPSEGDALLRALQGSDCGAPKGGSPAR